MAVFIAASDESYLHGNHRNPFFYGGFLAPLSDWSGLFAERWKKEVLDGPPGIPWLHMVDIRSKRWREENGITRYQAEERVKIAFEIISDISSLTPIGTDLNSGHLLDTFTKKLCLRSGAVRRFEPDYLAFVAYAYLVLDFCERARLDVEKVDFVVERNSNITKHIKEFYEDMPAGLHSIGLGRLVPLLGELIPGGKDRAPLQAADLLCWYSQRYRAGDLDDKNSRRYKIIAQRKGVRMDLTDNNVTQLWKIVTSDALKL